MYNKPESNLVAYTFELDRRRLARRMKFAVFIGNESSYFTEKHINKQMVSRESSICCTYFYSSKQYKKKTNYFHARRLSAELNRPHKVAPMITFRATFLVINAQVDDKRRGTQNSC